MHKRVEADARGHLLCSVHAPIGRCSAARTENFCSSPDHAGVCLMCLTHGVRQGPTQAFNPLQRGPDDGQKDAPALYGNSKSEQISTYPQVFLNDFETFEIFVENTKYRPICREFLNDIAHRLRFLLIAQTPWINP